MTKDLDFLQRLQETIKQVEPTGMQIYVGMLPESGGISIMPLAGGDETVFFDGSRDKDYNIAIMMKHRYDGNCWEYLNALYQFIERLDDIPSNNDSYDYNGAITSNLPSKVGQDSKMMNIWELDFTFKLNIYKGVNI